MPGNICWPTRCVFHVCTWSESRKEREIHWHAPEEWEVTGACKYATQNITNSNQTQSHTKLARQHAAVDSCPALFHQFPNNFSNIRTRNRIYCILLCVCGNHKMYLHCQPAATDVGKVGKAGRVGRVASCPVSMCYTFIKMQTASTRRSSRNTKINWKLSAFASVSGLNEHCLGIQLALNPLPHPHQSPHPHPRRMGIHLRYWLVCLHARRHAFKVSPVIDDIILWRSRSGRKIRYKCMCAKVPGVWNGNGNQ